MTNSNVKLDNVVRKILGDSKPVHDMIHLIKKVAATKTNILVIGESGTGKELVARMIHEAGPLHGKPFIPVNCGAIPETLIESEMFGYKRGSFTGAVGDKSGLFEAANGGTLFLDEVGELPLSMQVKLLRAIQERCFRKVGGTEDMKVDVRIIAATNRDLEAAVGKGTFREDLYYRLNVILIKTPSLRERRGDIRLLAEHFLKKFNGKFTKTVRGFTEDALKALEAHPWPGNIRELENVIERAVTLTNTDQIEIINFPQAFIDAVIANGIIDQKRMDALAGRGGKSSTVTPAAVSEIRLPAPDFTKGPLQIDEILGQVEKVYLLAAIEHTGGVKKKAAELLGITFRSIRYRLKKLGVETGDADLDEGGDEG